MLAKFTRYTVRYSYWYESMLKYMRKKIQCHTPPVHSLNFLQINLHFSFRLAICLDLKIW